MTFESGKKELYNKDRYLNNYCSYMFSKTNELFIYDGLPESIDIKKMEYFLQKNGFIFFTKTNDFHFYNGSLFDFDIYDEPTRINAILENRQSKQFDLSKDGVLIKNDFLMLGLSRIFKKYGVMLNECEITLYLNSIMNRIQFLINANDDKTKQEADMFINKIYKGDFSVIGSNAFFDGIEVNALNQSQNTTINNIELTQYIKASAFNEIGLNSNFNMKRERLNEKELSLNENAIKPFIHDMFDCRLKAVEQINKMYGLNITVKMSTLWDDITPINEQQGGNDDTNNRENNGDNIQRQEDTKSNEKTATATAENPEKDN